MIRNPRIVALLIGLTMAGCDPASPATSPQPVPACETTFAITAPNPAYVWTPNAIQLVSEELAPGVFAVYDADADEHAPAGIPLATSGGFVIGDDGVLLVESMINRQLFCQLIDLVREQTDKPIAYVVNTSSHGDHSYGNAFLPEGVQVVQHQRTAAYIAEHFEEDVVFMEANFGADQGIDEIEPVAADILVSDDGWSVDLGGATVEARYHGFAQTGGDLFVSVPSAGVMWTGNAVVAEKPALPWLLAGHAEEVAQTLAAARASLPAAAIVVPGHGRPVRDDLFDFSIDYLDTMVREVSAAVSMELSVTETVTAVSMESFQGYSLWDWIHVVVNVPTTYGELGGDVPTAR